MKKSAWQQQKKYIFGNEISKDEFIICRQQRYDEKKRTLARRFSDGLSEIGGEGRICSSFGKKQAKKNS